MTKPSRHLGSQAKRVLVLTALWFLVIQLGLAVAIERWLPDLRDPEYGSRALRLERRIARTSHDPLTVVMLGSSRTTLGFKAGQIEAPLQQALGRPVISYNLGFTGAGPLMQLIELHRLLALRVRPNLLLVEVLAPLMAGQMGKYELYRLPLNRAWHNELAILERYGRSREEMDSAWWHDWPIPWYSHRYAIVSRFFPACLPYQRRMDWAFVADESGWAPAPINRDSPQRHRQALENARNEYAPYLNGFQLGGPGPQALRELLDLCRQEQIRVALVLMPEGSEFRALYSPAAWSEIATFLGEISHEYAIPVVNAREWIVDEDFSDSHHLLLRGASAFTERLGRETVLPLLEASAKPILVAGRN